MNAEPRTRSAAPRDLYVIPSSPAQEWMWLIHSMRRGQSPYHIGGVFRVHGQLDLALLGRCLDALTERHEALRTVFRLEAGGELNQVIRDAVPTPIRTTSTEDWDAALAWCTGVADEEFDLAAGPLLRVAVAEAGTDLHAVLLIFHHIVSDGWSLTLVMNELTELYARLGAREPVSTQPPELQYADFAVWQRDWLQSPAAAEQLESWRSVLAGAQPLTLPQDAADAGQPSRETALQVPVQPDTLRGLHEVARAEQATLFMVLLGAVGAVLTRWSGQTDMVLATPVAGRTRQELENTVGFFVNTVPLRIDTSGGPSFRTVLRRARACCAHAFDNQDLPYERIVRLATPQLRGRRLATVMCALRNLPAPEPARLAGITLEPVEIPPRAGDFDLFIEFMFQPDGMLHATVAGTERFGEQTVHTFARSVLRAMRAVASDADVPISDLPGVPSPSQAG